MHAHRNYARSGVALANGERHIVYQIGHVWILESPPAIHGLY